MSNLNFLLTLFVFDKKRDVLLKQLLIADDLNYSNEALSSEKFAICSYNRL